VLTGHCGAKLAENFFLHGENLLNWSIALCASCAQGYIYFVLQPDTEPFTDPDPVSLEPTREMLLSITPSVLSAVRRMLGSNHPEVEDLTQEALEAFVRALPKFRGESSLKHFAKRIAVQRCLDSFRRNETRRKTLHELANTSKTQETPALVPALRLQRAWRSALTRVSEPQAEALGLRYVLGYTIDEIAKETCVSSNTVKSRLRVAKNYLREIIRSDPSLGDLVREHS